jgi:hypothetical protein
MATTTPSVTTTIEHGEIVVRCDRCPGWWNTGPGAAAQHLARHAAWDEDDSCG